jgi:hypothetical protein
MLSNLLFNYEPLLAGAWYTSSNIVPSSNTKYVLNTTVNLQVYLLSNPIINGTSNLKPFPVPVTSTTLLELSGTVNTPPTESPGFLQDASPATSAPPAIPLVQPTSTQQSSSNVVSVPIVVGAVVGVVAGGIFLTASFLLVQHVRGRTWSKANTKAFAAPQQKPAPAHHCNTKQAQPPGIAPGTTSPHIPSNKHVRGLPRHEATAAVVLQQQQLRVRPDTIILPAKASALLGSTRSQPPTQVEVRPQQGTYAASTQDQAVSTGMSFSMPGTGFSDPEHSSPVQAHDSKDHTSQSRAQQLALIERELKEIRQNLLMAHTSSQVMPSATGDCAAGASIHQGFHHGRTGSINSKQTSSASHDTNGCWGQSGAALADHIPGLLLVDTLG